MARRRRRYTNRRSYYREPQPPRRQPHQDPPSLDIIFNAIANALKWLWKRWINRRNPTGSPNTAAQLPQSNPSARPNRMPYQKVPVLTKGEKALVYPLIKAAKGNYLILCKVRLADVICCPANHHSESHWFNIISRYHVDFVLCDPKTTTPLLVIELDDRSHNTEKQSRRDKWKDLALQSAGLPLHRLPAQQAYDPIELANIIHRLIHPPAEPAPKLPVPPDKTTPASAPAPVPNKTNEIASDEASIFDRRRK